MKLKQKNIIKRVVDVALTVVLLCLMAYQLTGEKAHEWLGISMTALVVIHQALNAGWYSALFKGKYHAVRILQTSVNVLLLLSSAATAFCGMAMSGNAVPFLYGMIKVSLARQLHLAMSHWTFVLMGIHLGIHIPLMQAKLKQSDKKRMLFSVIYTIIAAIGLFFFIKNGMYNYMLLRASFAFFDFGKSAIALFTENLLALLFWAFIGTQRAALCKNIKSKK